MALARGSAGPSSTALDGHTVRGTQEGSGPELSGAAVGSLGWIWPTWLRARVFLAWPGPWDHPSPPLQSEVAFRPLHPPPRSSLASQECAHPRAQFSPAWPSPDPAVPAAHHWPTQAEQASGTEKRGAPSQTCSCARGQLSSGLSTPTQGPEQGGLLGPAPEQWV